MNEVAKVKKTADGITVDGYVFLKKDDYDEIMHGQKQINAIGKKVEGLIRNAAQLHFITGQKLRQAQEEFINYRLVQTFKQIAEITGLPERRVKTAMKIYQEFKDDPERLESLTVQECMRLIGEKEGEGSEKKKAEAIEYAGDERREFDFEELFERQPLSRVELNQYRVMVTGESEIWLVKKGLNVPMKIMDIFTGSANTPEISLAHKKLLHDVQSAAEEFYSVYERQEAGNS